MLVYDCVSIVFLLRLCLFVPTDSINFKMKTLRYIRSIKSTEVQSGTNGSLLLDHEEKKLRRFQQTDIIIDFIYVQHI